MMLSSCAPQQTPDSAPPASTSTLALPSRGATAPLAARTAATEAVPPTAASAPSSTPTVTETPTLPPTETETITPLPTVESLKAQVIAESFLSCRYGPGPNYLYLYGLRRGANIKLIGRTDGDNWHWTYVDGKNKCWVNTNYLDIEGDWLSLPIVYPAHAKLPVSPYYPPTDWVGAQRNRNMVEVSWNDVPLRAGDEEDERMQHYIVEVWRCEGGQLLFEPLATNDLAVTFVDEPGCSRPSHGRVFVQEKHGFAGPAEIPWPPYP